MTTIVQLTDLHLFEDRDSRLAGVDTWRSFEAVFAQVRRRHSFDYLILTGDLAQDERAATYAMLRDALGDCVQRCRIIPGNHDDPVVLGQAFDGLFAGETGSKTFELAHAGWRLIGLDSNVPGDFAGRIGDAQLSWLRARLSAAPDAPTVIFVHHPPIPINADWLDNSRLESDALLELVVSSPQIQGVFCGHVHQEFEGRIGAVPLYTTPSTCVQFGTRAERKFDPRAAGYRTITLHRDGRFETAVHRLE